MTHPRARALPTLIACLLLGLATSVLLAWSLRAWYTRHPSPYGRQAHTISAGSQSWEVTISNPPGRLSLAYQGLPPPGSDWAIIRNAGDPPPIPYTNEPAWAERIRTREPSLTGIGAYGWPWKCLLNFSAFSGRSVADHGVWITPGWLGPLSGLRLPTAPIWPGLAADTALFALLWWFPLMGAGLLRRARRARRGQCPACGYSLAGSPAGPCPECGAKSPAAAPGPVTPAAASPPAPAPDPAARSIRAPAL